MKKFIKSFVLGVSMLFVVHIQAENSDNGFPAKPETLINNSMKTLILKIGERHYEGNRIICSGHNRVCYMFDTDTNTLYLPMVNGGNTEIEVEDYEILEDGIIFTPR